MMSLEKRVKAQVNRLRKMAWSFLILAAVISGSVYLLPANETSYWLSIKGKEGFYILSSLFFFFGFYCFGAIWRRQNFI